MDTAWLPYNRQMSGRAYRVALWCVAIGYLAFVLAVGFWPSPVDEPVQPQITRALDNLHTQGLPKTVDYGAVEFAANVWFFVPVGALLAALLPLRLWWVAPLGGVALSSTLELGQLAFRAERLASWYDVTANSLGALVGATLVVVVRLGVARVLARRSTATAG
ncbi:MAG: VanZ family protein [Microbacteriaceae bacterium]